MTTTEEITIGVILVNWKRAADTEQCIRSLSSLLRDNLRIVLAIFDNSSAITNEELSKRLRSLEVKPPRSFSVTSTPIKSYILDGTPFTIINSIENVGFAGGNNGAHIFLSKQQPEPDYYWFLNNDTEVERDCLLEMLNKFRQPGRKVGMVGSTMVYFHDKKTVQALGGSVYKPWTGTMREIGNGLQWPCPVDEAAVEAQMSYVCGASMLVSADLIRDVGLMQEDYFLFFEEIDWCERARKAGYELAYASQAVVFHKEGAAIGTGTGARRSLLAEYYGMRNKLKVTWRFFPWAMPTVWLISWLQVLRRLMQGRPANAWLMARVLLGLGQRPAT